MQTQWLDPDALRRYQDRLTSMLVAHAAKHVPFYRDTRRLSAVYNDKTGEVDLNRWHEIPVLTRQEAREAGKYLQAEWVPPEAGAAEEVKTSGSTGSPFVFLRSASMSVASECCTARHYNWHRIPQKTVFAHLRHGRPPSALPNDVPATIAADTSEEPAYPAMLLDISRESTDPIAWLEGNNLRHVVTYPTFAHAMARDVQRGKCNPIQLQHIFCFGEILTEEARHDIAEAFKARQA